MPELWLRAVAVIVRDGERARCSHHPRDLRSEYVGYSGYSE